MVLHQREQAQRVGGRRHGGQRRDAGFRLRIQFHDRARDDAEGTLGADVQVAQIVARIVLAQAAQAAPDLALRRDHFQAQAQLARISVAQHGRAARVRRQISPDGATAFGRQRQGEQTAGGAGRFLDGLQNAARIHRDGAVDGIERADAVQARQRQHDGRAGVVGNAAQHQACVAALWHDGHLPLRAGAQHARHLFHRGGAQHGQGLARKPVAPVGEEGRRVGVVGEYISVAQQVAAGGEEICLVSHFLMLTLFTFSSSSLAMRLAAFLYGRRYSTAQTK
ncbi:hypothetical protein D3C85_247300 [compost metagenome]